MISQGSRVGLDVLQEFHEHEYPKMGDIRETWICA